METFPKDPFETVEVTGGEGFGKVGGVEITGMIHMHCPLSGKGIRDQVFC